VVESVVGIWSGESEREEAVVAEFFEDFGREMGGFGFGCKTISSSEYWVETDEPGFEFGPVGNDVGERLLVKISQDLSRGEFCVLFCHEYECVLGKLSGMILWLYGLGK